MQLQSGAAAFEETHSVQVEYLEQVEHLGWQARYCKQTNQYVIKLFSYWTIIEGTMNNFHKFSINSYQGNFHLSMADNIHPCINIYY